MPMTTRWRRPAARARVIADAVNLARDLINEPPAAKSPTALVEVARQIASTGGLDITVYEPDQFEAERFGGLIGVAAGSHQPAAMIVLRHEPADPKGFIALVGKGIVFDSGGLSLKPPAGMETMKTDMSGAAVVLATMQAIAALDLPVRVVGVTPVTENMPGGGAQRPGDVLTPRNGTTVEVLNTDAEGRLVLADALSLVAEEEPDLIVDAATLTGACPVALGEKIAGLWGNTDEAIEQVKAAAADAGEAVWHMPLPSYYRKNIDSDVADIKNTGTRYGGSINAALFLKEFVGEVPWVHLDIAGPARWPDDEHYQVKGGSRIRRPHPGQAHREGRRIVPVPSATVLRRWLLRSRNAVDGRSGRSALSAPLAPAASTLHRDGPPLSDNHCRT